MKLIGQGAFTKAYQLNDKQVLLKSIDPIKECMSLGWFPSSRLFPKLVRLDKGEYVSKLYKKEKSLKKALKPKHYDRYRSLVKLYNKWAWFSLTLDYGDSYSKWVAAFNSLEDVYLKKALLSALDACANYGSDVCFECSPRNVAVDNGNLILLDCFFIESAKKLK